MNIKNICTSIKLIVFFWVVSLNALAQSPIVRNPKLCERLESESRKLMQAHYEALDYLGQGILSKDSVYQGFQNRFDQNNVNDAGYFFESSNQKSSSLNEYLDAIVSEKSIRHIKTLQIKFYQKQITTGRPAKITLRVWILANITYQKVSEKKEYNQNMVFYVNFPTRYKNFVESGKYEIDSVEWNKAKIYQFSRADENKVKEFATDGNYFNTQDCNCDKIDAVYKRNKDYSYTFQAAHLRLYQGKTVIGELTSLKLGKERQWNIPTQIGTKKVALGSNYKIEFLDANRNSICLSKEFRIKGKNLGLKIGLPLFGVGAGFLLLDKYVLKRFIFKEDADLPEPILPKGDGE